jgi:hypothetical protein
MVCMLAAKCTTVLHHLTSQRWELFLRFTLGVGCPIASTPTSARASSRRRWLKQHFEILEATFLAIHGRIELPLLEVALQVVEAHCFGEPPVDHLQRCYLMLTFFFRMCFMLLTCSEWLYNNTGLHIF